MSNLAIFDEVRETHKEAYHNVKDVSYFNRTGGLRQRKYRCSVLYFYHDVIPLHFDGIGLERPGRAEDFSEI